MHFFLSLDILSGESHANLLHCSVICSLYDLANVVPTLAKFYHQASESYEQACLRHVSMVIYIVSMPNIFHLWHYLLAIDRILLKVWTESHFWNSNHIYWNISFQHFEKLFQFARRVEELMHTIPPEEVSACNFVVKCLQSASIASNLLDSCECWFLKGNPTKTPWSLLLSSLVS